MLNTTITTTINNPTSVKLDYYSASRSFKTRVCTWGYKYVYATEMKIQYDRQIRKLSTMLDHSDDVVVDTTSDDMIRAQLEKVKKDKKDVLEKSAFLLDIYDDELWKAYHADKCQTKAQAVTLLANWIRSEMGDKLSDEAIHDKALEVSDYVFGGNFLVKGSKNLLNSIHTLQTTSDELDVKSMFFTNKIQSKKMFFEILYKFFMCDMMYKTIMPKRDFPQISDEVLAKCFPKKPSAKKDNKKNNKKTK